MKMTIEITQAYQQLMQSLFELDNKFKQASREIASRHPFISERDMTSLTLKRTQDTDIVSFWAALDKFRTAVLIEAFHEEARRQSEFSLDRVMKEIERIKCELSVRSWVFNTHDNEYHYAPLDEDSSMLANTKLSPITKGFICSSSEIYRQELFDCDTLLSVLRHPDRHVVSDNSKEINRISSKLRPLLKDADNKNSKETTLQQYMQKTCLTSAAMKDIVPIEKSFRLSPEPYMERASNIMPLHMKQQLEMEELKVISDADRQKIINEIDAQIRRMTSEKQGCYFSSSKAQYQKKISKLSNAKGTLLTGNHGKKITASHIQETLNNIKPTCQIHSTWLLRSIAPFLPLCLMKPTRTSKWIDSVINKIKIDHTHMNEKIQKSLGISF